MEEIVKYKINDEEIIIGPFRKEYDSIPEITRLLHSSYKVLADMGFRYLASHQDDNETLDRIKEGHSFIARHSTKIISTITLYFNHERRHDAEFYNRNDVAHFGQFAVDNDFQRKGLGNFMMNIVEDKARTLGAKYIALDTAENAKYLIGFYGRRGYKFVQFANWKVTNYRSVIMSYQL